MGRGTSGVLCALRAIEHNKVIWIWEWSEEKIFGRLRHKEMSAVSSGGYT